MKAKYNRMIDEFVKKKYGDLDRGVLSPEVQYKVLFKIYRKKYRKEKERVKILREEKGSWSIYSTSTNYNPCDGCEHYVPMYAKSNGLSCAPTIVPESCEIGKSMTACCPFYSAKMDEIKVQKAVQEEKKDSYLDWLHDDITWCCRECSDMDCERNLMNRKMTTGFISMADMFDPFKCPVDAEIPIDKKDKKC